MLSRTTGQAIRERRLALGISGNALAIKASVHQPALCLFELKGVGIGLKGRDRIDVVLTELEREQTKVELDRQREVSLIEFGRQCVGA